MAYGEPGYGTQDYDQRGQRPGDVPGGGDGRWQPPEWRHGQQPEWRYGRQRHEQGNGHPGFAAGPHQPRPAPPAHSGQPSYPGQPAYPGQPGQATQERRAPQAGPVPQTWQAPPAGRVPRQVGPAGQWDERRPTFPPSRPPRWGPADTKAAIVTGTVVAMAAVVAVFWVQHHRAPQDCAQQYAAWKSGTGASEGAVVKADVNSLNAAGKADDIKKVNAALAKIGSDATADEAHPMPACADPAGYWPQVLSALHAAGDNASVTPGLAGLVTAEAPLKPLPGIESKLTAELKRTTVAKAG